jgi:ADP-ribose pyrophosphatase YjhB (NUDIX family)
VKKKTSLVPQAGAIAFKIVEDAPQILLVRAKKTPEHWIFPKGHIEVGETAEEAAGRELAEEAGVRGEPAGLVGTVQFRSGDKDVRVTYYLFVFLSEVLRKEKRERRWCSYDEALNLLSHENTADLLRKALPLIETHLPQKRIEGSNASI